MKRKLWGVLDPQRLQRERWWREKGPSLAELRVRIDPPEQGHQQCRSGASVRLLLLPPLGVTQSSRVPDHPAPSWCASSFHFRSCYCLSVLCCSFPAPSKEALLPMKLCNWRPSCQYLFGVCMAVLTSFLVTALLISVRKTNWVPFNGGKKVLPSAPQWLCSQTLLRPKIFLFWGFFFSPQYHTFLIICATSWVILRSALDYLLKVDDKNWTMVSHSCPFFPRCLC